VVEFSKRQDVERWLKNKPREIAVIIAARAALRVVPILSESVQQRGDKAGKRELSLILAVLRATAAAWVAIESPTRTAAAARSASYAAYNYDNSVAAAASSSSAVAAYTDEYAARGTAAIVICANASARVADIHGAGVEDTELIAYTAVSSDASLIDEGVQISTLSHLPLWLKGSPRWARDSWIRLKNVLRPLDEDWDVWMDWYEARLEGSPANEALEIARVLIADEIWRQGPKVVNAEIKRLINEHEAIVEREIFDSAFERGSELIREALRVPSQRPAAVEPIWQKGRLTVPKKPAKTDLNKKKFEAALSALRAELRELADDVSAEANIDKRPAAFLRRLAERIPTKMPQQDELFRLGHVEAIFAGYAKTVDQEWPDFLASRYHAVALQFDRTLRQVPLWREFKRNAAKETLSVAQVADSTALAREAASALQQNEAASFVDPAIPHSLEQLADALPVAKAGEEPPPDAIDAGKQLLAADLIESVNNTLKPIAEVALSAARDYADGVAKGFKKAAKKQGPIDGEKAFKWLRRLAVGGGVGGGSFVALSNLIAKFPEAFGWLERVLHFLK